MSDTCIRRHSSRQLHLALAGLALAAVDFARRLVDLVLAAVDAARHLAGFALDLAVFALDLVVFVLNLAGFVLDLAGFVLDLAGSALVDADIAPSLAGVGLNLAGFALPLAGLDHAAADLALAPAGSALALLLPAGCLPKIANVSRSPQLHWQAILLDLPLYRPARLSRNVPGQYLRRVPYEGGGFELNALLALILDRSDHLSSICNSYSGTNQPRLASLQRESKSSNSISEAYHE